MLQLQKSVRPEVSKGEKDFCKRLSMINIRFYAVSCLFIQNRCTSQVKAGARPSFDRYATRDIRDH